MIARAILRRRRRRQRPAVLALAGLGVALLSLTPTERAVPWLVWNASASAPVGLYRAPNAPISVTQTTPIPSGRGLFFTLRTPFGASFSASKNGLFVPLATATDATD